MSVHATKAVWKQSTQSGRELLVLLAIADFANDSGTAYPSVATLARMIRTTERNTRFAIANLIASGELAVERGAGPRGCNVFTLKLASGGMKPASGLKSTSGVKAASAGGEVDFHDGVKPTSPELSLNHHKLPVEPAKLPGKRVKRQEVTFADFCRTCEEQGIMSIAEDDPVFSYAQKVGIPVEFLELAWRVFEDRHRHSSKRQKDWRAVYRNAVNGNWYKLWFFNDAGICQLTTAGVQARRAESAAV